MKHTKNKKKISKRKRPTKQFCPQGHDTFVVGRNTHTGRCNTCTTDQIKEWKKLNPEKHNACYKRWQAANKPKHAARIKRWREKNPEKALAIQKRFEEANPNYDNEWRENHPELLIVYRIKTEKERSLRVVGWTDWDAIKKMEKKKPKGMTLDHYIPLRGKLVAGLHVSWNLQYLTSNQNSRKGRKINLLEASEWYGKILSKAGVK